MVNQHKEKCSICEKETEHFVIEIKTNENFKYYCEECYEKENPKISID